MKFNSGFKGLTNLNKYLHNDTSETEVNISVQNGSEKFLKKKHCDFW